MDDNYKELMSTEEKEGIIEYFKKRLSSVIENKEKEFNDVVGAVSSKIDELWKSFEEERKRRYEAMQSMSRENAMLSNEIKKENIRAKEFINEKEKEFSDEKEKFVSALKALKTEVSAEREKWLKKEREWHREKKELLETAEKKDSEAVMLRQELFRIEKEFRLEMEKRERDFSHYKNQSGQKISSLEERLKIIDDFRKKSHSSNSPLIKGEQGGCESSPSQEDYFPSNIKELKDYLDKKEL